MKMKGYVAAALLGCLLIMSGCMAGPRTAMEIGGAKVDAEIYAYYLDYALSNPGEFPGKTAEEAASAQCSAYVSVNTKFREYGCALTTEQKVKATQNTNDLWHLYEAYYTEIGVSKQSLAKVETNRAYSDSLLMRLYDTDGIQPVGEEELRAYFAGNYIVFQAINGYLTETDANGVVTVLPAEKQEALRAQFDGLAARVNNGEDMSTVNASYLASLGATPDGSLQALIIERNNKNYPAGFFDQVAAAETGKALTVVADSYIYVVRRSDPLAADAPYYSQYRAAVLRAYKQDTFNAKVQEEWAPAYPVKSSQSVIRRASSAVLKKHPGSALADVFPVAQTTGSTAQVTEPAASPQPEGGEPV